MQSMTGFGGREGSTEYGKISVELRSANHKFFEAVIHLPAGYLSLEDKIRKILEGRLKRGRVICVVTFTGTKTTGVHINESLLRSYVHIIRSVRKRLAMEQEVALDTIIQLPGVLQLDEKRLSPSAIWSQVHPVVSAAMADLVRMRAKEGRSLQGFLRSRARLLQKDLAAIQQRFRAMVKEKLAKLKADDERVSFLKSSDITEEIERLAFHIRNFTSKLTKSGPVGKELDFIAQEMQREANTLAAKSCDVLISGRVVQMKSQIERIREQVQNAE